MSSEVDPRSSPAPESQPKPCGAPIVVRGPCDLTDYWLETLVEKRHSLSAWLLPVPLLAVWLAFEFWNGDTRRIMAACLISAVALFYLAIMLGAYFGHAVRELARAFDASVGRWELADDGLRLFSTDESWLDAVTWAGLLGWSASPRVLLLCAEPGVLLLLPRRLFATQADWESALKLAEAKLGPSDSSMRSRIRAASPAPIDEIAEKAQELLDRRQCRRAEMLISESVDQLQGLSLQNALWLRSALRKDLWRYGEALADASRALALARSPRNLVLSGVLHARCGNVESAEAGFAESQRWKPSLQTLLSLARAFDELGQSDRALEMVSQATTEAPSMEARLLVCEARLALQDWEAALADLNDVLQAEARNVRALELRARTWREFGKLEQALADINLGLDAEPCSPDLLATRGMIRSDLGDLEGALEDLETARAIVPNSGDFTYALVLARCGRGPEAATELRELLSEQPSVQRHAALAWILATSPDPNVRDARQALHHAQQAAAQCKRPIAQVLDTMAAAYAANGQFAEAAQYETAALEHPRLDPLFRAQAQARLEGYHRHEAYVEPQVVLQGQTATEA